MVVGHFSSDGLIKREHFMYSKEDQRHDFVVVEGKSKIADYLVAHFSTNTVLISGLYSGMLIKNHKKQ